MRGRFSNLMRKINITIASFTKKEWRIFGTLLVILVVSTILILNNINNSFMVSIPRNGGSLSEGVIGTPRFVNPVLAFSDVDRDLVSLIYSGLMRKDTTGNFVNDLAESYEVSSDGLTYTFKIKDDAFFQDGSPVTADDVVFTINEIKDPVIKSPRKGNWDGVTVQKIDNKTVAFNLKQPYASFLENTTLGIMPAKLWNNSPIELNSLNTSPVGSGPYQVDKLSKQSSGIIENYKLASFDKFELGKPYIKNLNLNFYANENELISALENGDVEQISSITPASAETLKEKGYRVESSVLPRVFGLFFNQSQNQIFTDKAVVKAINQIIDKDRIVREVLDGYGVVINDPIPPNMIEYQKLSNQSRASHADDVKNAVDALGKDGWKLNADGVLEKSTTDKNKKKSATTLQFSISTGNAPELSKAAELIREDLAEAGIRVEVKTFEIGNLNQSVIRPRKYDALFFGEIINDESDLFAFWHSSQRKDPGLNVALYTNSKVDKILEDASVTIDEKARIQKYAQFESEIAKDLPAVFLYSPNFIYVVSKNISGLNIDHLTTPQDRFLNVYSWYTEKDNVWKIFSKTN
jgi:peptide/nickel transport system substrate-binding protein